MYRKKNQLCPRLFLDSICKITASYSVWAEWYVCFNKLLAALKNTPWKKNRKIWYSPWNLQHTEYSTFATRVQSKQLFNMLKQQLACESVCLWKCHKKKENKKGVFLTDPKNVKTKLLQTYYDRKTLKHTHAHLHTHLISGPHTCQMTRSPLIVCKY